ncbi:MAG: GNAT family N-acetyltransferase [Panacagrimonas sp.]
MAALAPVRLEGRHVVLDPLLEADADTLHGAADDPELFRYLPEPLSRIEHHRAFVQRALAEQAQGKALPFVIRLRDSGDVVGTTRFGAIELAHKRAEIGWTWIARRVQRTAVNTEAKRLLLGFGFEQWGLNRIEFKTDHLNQKSRAAIARIGAIQEGIFRNHMVVPDGRIRDTVYFSIVCDEWPAIRTVLDARLNFEVPLVLPAKV